MNEKYSNSLYWNLNVTWDLFLLANPKLAAGISMIERYIQGAKFPISYR